MPRAVYILALGIFAMVTSEFLVAGLMPQIARDLGVGISQVGYLITAFAVAMALGGPLLTAALAKLPHTSALTVLFAIFLAGNVSAAVAGDYWFMLLARVVTGTASAAFFGIAMSICVQLTAPQLRGRAISMAMNGLMLGTLLGLPLSTVLGTHLGWRAAFSAVGVLTVVAWLCTAVGVPRSADRAGDGPLDKQRNAFGSPWLWLAMSTSLLIIGATFAAFTYLTPILTEVTGFATDTVPLLLVAYGAATVVGNYIVGRLAVEHTLRVLLIGLLVNVCCQLGFAVLADSPWPAVVCMLGIGLVGVTMNPAMITRVQRNADSGPMVNSVHTSFITGGVVVGSWLGGLGVDNFGLRAPLWLGATLAALGIVTVLPDLARRTIRPPRRQVRDLVAGAARSGADVGG